MRILITGAAGNLGSLLSRHLVPTGHELWLMYHRAPLPADVVAAANVRPVKADLADCSTLPAAVEGADVVIHFAGRLFAPRPETFLVALQLAGTTSGVTAELSRYSLRRQDSKPTRIRFGYGKTRRCFTCCR